jgi:hypothetical protein
LQRQKCNSLGEKYDHLIGSSLATLIGLAFLRGSAITQFSNDYRKQSTDDGTFPQRNSVHRPEKIRSPRTRNFPTIRNQASCRKIDPTQAYYAVAMLVQQSEIHSIFSVFLHGNP